MRRALVVVGGALGAAAFWHKRHRRVQAELPPGPDPAEELRAKLAANKAAAVEEPPREAAPPPGEPLTEAASTLDPETRRRALHEQARASMDQLGTD